MLPINTRRNSFQIAASLKLWFVTRCAAMTPFTETVALQSKTSAIKTVIANRTPYAIQELYILEKSIQAINTVIVNVASRHTASLTVYHLEVISVRRVMVPAETA